MSEVNPENPLDGLTALQLRFVQEYAKDSSSVKKAAKRAGYSLSTADSAGGRLNMDPKIKAAIRYLQDKALSEMGITVEKVLQELWKVAGANPGDVVTLDESGEAVLDATKASEVAVTVIKDKKGDKEVKSVTTKTVKPADKVSALVQVAKMMNLFPKQEVEVTGVLSLTELIESSFEKTAIAEKTVLLESEDI